MTLPRLILITSTLLSCTLAPAATLTGKVILVSDGDTITVKTSSNETVRVRLAEIDAPETGQPFGPQAKQSLIKLCFGRTARFNDKTKDRYGRTVSRVKCNGTDAQTYQLKNGMAWVYDHYVTDRSLYRIQRQAQHQKRGLWADQEPTAPWDYRRQQRLVK